MLLDVIAYKLWARFNKAKGDGRMPPASSALNSSAASAKPRREFRGRLILDNGDRFLLGWWSDRDGATATGLISS